jgi:hypothetical protein
MNAFEIIGLACVDDEFRTELFNQTANVKTRNPNLTFGERAGLDRITAVDYPQRDDLQAKMGQVGQMLKACANPPCPWPSAFAQYEIPMPMPPAPL